MNKQDLQKLKKLRQRRATQRRFLMYGVLGVLVATLTVAIVMLAEGYYINPTDKQVIQNGLVLIDSKPRGASVTINGRLEKDRTESRLTLPQGNYSFKINKKGYREWSRRFALGGSEVVDLNYIRLIPSTIKSTEVTRFTKPLTLSTQSPDRKWLLTHTQDAATFDVADLTSKTYTSTKLAVPADLSALGLDLNSARVVEWSTDNEHVLLELTQGEQKRFWVISRANATQWFDVGARYGLSVQKVTLRDKKWDKLFVLDANGDLRDADVNANTISAPRLQRVITYASYGPDKLAVAQRDQTTERANLIIMEKAAKKIISTTTVQAASDYLLDINQYDDNWYAAYGSKQDRAVKIYLNPFEDLKTNSPSPQKPLTILDAVDPIAIGFSGGSQFLGLQDGNGFVIFDFEYQRTYRYTTGLALENPDRKVAWLDGNHLLLRVAGQQHLIDYDGLNLQNLGSARNIQVAAFDKAGESFVAVAPTADGAADTLVRYDLLTPEDQ